MRIKNLTQIMLTVLLMNSMALADSVSKEDVGVEEIMQELPAGPVVYPQEQGELQISSGINNHKNGDTDIPLNIEYGLTDKLQVELELEPVPEVSELGLLYNVFNQRTSGWAFSTAIDLIFEDGKRENIKPALIAYKAVGHSAINVSLAHEDSQVETSIAGLHKWQNIALAFEVINITTSSTNETLIAPKIAICSEPIDNIDLEVGLSIIQTVTEPTDTIYLFSTSMEIL